MDLCEYEASLLGRLCSKADCPVQKDPSQTTVMTTAATRLKQSSFSYFLTFQLAVSEGNYSLYYELSNREGHCQKAKSGRS